MAYCHLLVLFVAAAAASPSPQLAADAEDVQNVLQQLLGSKESQYVSNDHHSHHAHDDRDSANVETLNLLFKHDKIIPSGSIPKPATIDEDSNNQLVPIGDMLTKLGTRCGCGGNVARCDHERSSPCNLDHEHAHGRSDNVVYLQINPDYNKESKGRYSNQNDKKMRADPNIVKLLDDLESSLLTSSNSNQNNNDLDEHFGLFYGNDRKNDNEERDDDEKRSGLYIDALIKELEKPLGDSEKYDEENKTHLRCCKNCARKSFYRNGDDDKDYLRCCKNCGGKSYARIDDRDRRDRSDDKDRRERSYDRDRRDRSDDRDRRDRSNDRDRRDRSSDRDRKGRSDDGYHKDRSDDRDHRDRSDDRDHRDRSDDRGSRDRSHDRDHRDTSNSNLLNKAKVFQINDGLDAIVLDGSNLKSVLKFLNNRNSVDKSNSIRDYVKAIHAESENKAEASNYQDRSLPASFLQKLKLKDLYRRSDKSQPQYGAPFELDVQGLGQVNL